MHKFLLITVLLFSQLAMADGPVFRIPILLPCISSDQIGHFLFQKFDLGQPIIRRTSLEGVNWNLAAFYKSKPEETFQYGRSCGASTVFYNSLTSSTVGEHLVTTLSSPVPTGDIKWAFYRNEMMMELIKYTHNGLPSRDIRCRIVDVKSPKEKIICQNSAGGGKVAYSCFVKNLSTEASSCFSD